MVPERSTKPGGQANLLEADLCQKIIGAAIEVHRHLGPGLLESIYEAALAFELTHLGLKVERQKSVAIDYKGLRFDEGFRIDLFVAERIVMELKCVESILPIHEAQILSYLQLTKVRIGLLINFKAPALRHGIKRFVI
ncbi:MAG TPA: GxxExxY protein [Candidatus Didemnitutus sp.]|jgi:GxxExxY protein